MTGPAFSDDVAGDQEPADVSTLLDLAVAELGGVPREGQRRMATQVVGALAARSHLLVQAGTGTGKSLAYLVPAVAHAVQTDERVVVSTATLALQRQVLTRDLPLVADALAPALGREPRIALLKGWHNYVCVHKVDGGYPPEESAALFDLAPGPGQAADEHPDAEPDRSGPSRLGEEVLRVREWAAQTDTGDRDDLVPGVSERAWRQVSVTRLECLGPQCPALAECFAERSRGRAHAADVVVTNHAMLGIAAAGNAGVLPEHGALVVDEAHELTDRITAQATLELSVGAVDAAARLARRAGVATPELDAAAARLGATLVDLPEGRFPTGLPDEVAASAAGVRDAAREVLTALGTGPRDAATDSARKVAHATVLVLFEIAERMVAEPDGRDVLWASRGPDRERGGLTRLYVAPLDVAGLVRTHLLPERAAVFTSATLALGGTFEPIARRLGLVGPAGTSQTWTGVDVGTPFDYARQGILYIARHLPAPGREPATAAQLDEIAELVAAAGGRTLGLFSSHRAAAAAATAMRERLDTPVLCQGDDRLPTLVAQFAADPATSLFGTLSLWQGVDVPGPSCQLVLIDRIPFPRPDDPVAAARSEAAVAAGGNGFMHVSAAHAALLLAQGAGRLVRTATDRGVVAVLDPRLSTARYGTFLLRSMPPLWPTTDLGIVTGALRRLAGPGQGAAPGEGSGSSLSI